MSTNLPDIGSPPSSVDTNLRKWLLRLSEHVRELRGFTGDAAGVAGSGTGGTGAPSPAGPPGPQGPVGPPGTPDPYVPDLSPPPTPSGVNVVAGIDFVAITTDPPVFSQGHGYARTMVYGAKYPGSGALPTFASATLQHEFVGNVGSFPTEPATQWHIWLKWRTIDGVESSVPHGGTNGTQVTTGQNVANLLTALTGQITQSQLFSALGTRIDLIDAPAGTAGSVNARIATESAARTSGDAANAASISSLSATVSSNNTTVLAAVSSEASARAAGDAANASQITTVQSRLNRVVNYRIQSFGLSSTVGGVGFYTEDGTLLFPGVRSYTMVVINGTNGNVLSSQTYDVYGNGANTSGRNAATLAADLNALPADRVVVIFTYDEPLTNLNTSGLPAALKRCGASQVTLNRFKARGAYILVGIPGIGEGGGVERYAGDVDNATNAWCEYHLQLVNGRPVALGGQPIAASVQQEITTRASETGFLGAQYTLRVTAGNIIGGFGISGTSGPGAGGTIDFGIRANTFFIAPPVGVGGVSNIVPFAVQTTPVLTPAGELLPAGVYMDAAYIRGLEATLARFQTAIITNAMIASLSASKITAGSLAVGEYIQSASFTPGSTGFRIDGGGNVEIRNSGGTRVFNLGASGTQPVLKVGSALELLANGTATFSGNLSAAGGTFSGDISASTGTLNAARITGQLTAGQIAVGAGTQNSSGSFSGVALSNSVGTWSVIYDAASGTKTTPNSAIHMSLDGYLRVDLNASFGGLPRDFYFQELDAQIVLRVGGISYDSALQLKRGIEFFEGSGQLYVPFTLTRTTDAIAATGAMSLQVVLFYRVKNPAYLGGGTHTGTVSGGFAYSTATLLELKI